MWVHTRCSALLQTGLKLIVRDAAVARRSPATFDRACRQDGHERCSVHVTCCCGHRMACRTCGRVLESSDSLGTCEAGCPRAIWTAAAQRNAARRCFCPADCSNAYYRQSGCAQSPSLRSRTQVCATVNHHQRGPPVRPGRYTSDRSACAHHSTASAPVVRGDLAFLGCRVPGSPWAVRTNAAVDLGVRAPCHHSFVRSFPREGPGGSIKEACGVRGTVRCGGANLGGVLGRLQGVRQAYAPSRTSWDDLTGHSSALGRSVGEVVGAPQAPRAGLVVVPYASTIADRPSQIGQRRIRTVGRHASQWQVAVTLEPSHQVAVPEPE
ncbi:hypothetical protein FKP32DRAFT_152884 [Trametes sanguinea]|nr:hypothetical protein FKP32DRAFT_152884 [Trametes sanguinea]